MACVEEDSSNVSDLIGWAITIISNVDACDVGWPRQTKEWQEWSNVAECINEKKVSVRDIRDALADELKWPELKEVKCK